MNKIQTGFLLSYPTVDEVFLLVDKIDIPRPG
jgi:hypothetical protein